MKLRTSPIMYGEPASPKAWEIKIEKASAEERRVGITVYCKKDALFSSQETLIISAHQ